MQTSLQAIANKAEKEKECRFRNLYTMLNIPNLEDSWKFMNRKAAPGVDRITVREYERKLAGNVENLVERLKEKRYRAKLVKRVHIPKGKGKTRPLGLPALEDKLLQTAVARILNAIYEQDFQDCSFGYRPKVGPHDAVKDITRTLQFGKFNYIVEADIKGFFDNIDHDRLIEMLELRIDDSAFIRLIKKWLRAGVLDTDGQVLHPATGTPQGGVVSPVLANVYLHHVLDLWFEKVVKPHCSGAAYLCRFADDFVCAFQYKKDAERFYSVLPKRLGKFGLEAARDKTRIISFSRFRKEEKTCFEFLGFEYRWGVSRKGRDLIQRRTSRKKFRNSLRNLTIWVRDKRSIRMREFFRRLNARLRGYYNYYGIIGNYRSLAEFEYHMRRILFKWLNRRSQKKSFNWQVFDRILYFYRIERPGIRESSFKQLSLPLH